MINLLKWLFSTLLFTSLISGCAGLPKSTTEELSTGIESTPIVIATTQVETSGEIQNQPTITPALIILVFYQESAGLYPQSMDILT